MPKRIKKDFEPRDSSSVPEGFKRLDNGDVVCDAPYPGYRLQIEKPAPLLRSYLADGSLKHKLYVGCDHMQNKDIDQIVEYQSTLKKEAEKRGFKFTPFYDHDQDELKLTVYMEIPPEKKQKVRETPEEFKVKGTFTLSKVFKYQPNNEGVTYYGANLVCPRNARIGVELVQGEEGEVEQEDTEWDGR